MPKWLLVFMGLLVIGCCGDDVELAECQDRLAECNEALANIGGPEVVEEAAFKFVLANDSFGSFLPFNNQFSAYVGTTTPYYSGFFVQLANIDYGLHPYDGIQLVWKEGPATVLPRKEVKWVDIVCAEGFPTVLQPAEAQQLLPVQEVAGSSLNVDPATLHRRIHQDMDAQKMMALVTIWQDTQGLLSVDTWKFKVPDKEDDPDAGMHWHDGYAFKSQSACEVRIWSDLDSATTPTVYSIDDPNPLVAVHAVELGPPAQHGSVHNPPWN